MSVVISPESKFAQEMRKWEAHHSPYGPPGRPYDPNVKWPAMFYRIDHGPNLSPDIVERVEAADETMAANLYSRGFGNGAAEAMEIFTKRQAEIATLAANRAHQELRMSDKAREEAARVDASTSDHVPVIPETPIRRAGRLKKTDTVQ